MIFSHLKGVLKEKILLQINKCQFLLKKILDLSILFML